MEKRGLKTVTSAKPETLPSVGQKQPIWRKHVYLRIKRIQDIILSAAALVLLSPLLMLIMLAVVIDNHDSSPIFSQVRCGKGGEAFRLYKFRTMCLDNKKQPKELLPNKEIKIENYAEITWLGQFLRSTGLDELPQLLNILKGDMSIVGPRPLLFRDVMEFTKQQRQILAVVPGLTCFWRVCSARDRLSLDEGVELDLRYISEQSWKLDWKLIFLTLKAIILGE